MEDLHIPILRISNKLRYFQEKIQIEIQYSQNSRLPSRIKKEFIAIIVEILFVELWSF